MSVQYANASININPVPISQWLQPATTWTIKPADFDFPPVVPYSDYSEGEYAGHWQNGFKDASSHKRTDDFYKNHVKRGTHIGNAYAQGRHDYREYAKMLKQLKGTE